jgi:hypothetical protein
MREGGNEGRSKNSNTHYQFIRPHTWLLLIPSFPPSLIPFLSKRLPIADDAHTDAFDGEEVALEIDQDRFEVWILGH